MSKIIIGIHGLGNKVPANVLSLWWESAIIEGFSRHLPESHDFDFELIYWANFLHPVPLDPIVADKKHHLHVEDPYIPAPKFVQEEKSSLFRKRVLDYLGDQLNRLFLNEDLSINFSSISDYVIHRFFSDLEVYYTADARAQHTVADSIREQVCRYVADALRKHRKREILLIAHSMGSIIAFDVLTRYAPEVEIDTLITIGSPLGLPIIRSRIGAEMEIVDGRAPVLKTPDNVKREWHNLADLRDKIAFFYKLTENYQANTADVRVVDHSVVNNYTYRGEKNPHKAFGYLRTPEMANLIDAFLQRQPPSLLQRLQSYLRERAQQWFRPSRR